MCDFSDGNENPAPLEVGPVKFEGFKSERVRDFAVMFARMAYNLRPIYGDKEEYCPSDIWTALHGLDEAFCDLEKRLGGVEFHLKELDKFKDEVSNLQIWK